MPERYDIAIVGLGAMGSAAAFHCARRGKKVLGLDQFLPPHQEGSSHGQTRIIREAYFEHPLYVPLIQRAYELWDELERLTGERLIQQTGGLMIGQAEGILVSGALLSARKHGLRHEVLSAEELRERYPALNPAAGTVAVWEPRAGILFPEKCIAAHLQEAEKQGATLRLGEAVRHWEATTEGVRIGTERGEYEAGKLVFCAGSWLSTLVSALPVALTLERQVLFWFKPAEPEHFKPEALPIFIWEYAPGEAFYGFPDVGNGVKVAQHHAGEAAGPGKARRPVAKEEFEQMQGLLRPFLPGLREPLRAETCIYTNTPNNHFLLDFHPAHQRVLLASPCSGHGFKFSSVIGEVIANMADEGEWRFDLSLFTLAGHTGGS